MNFAEFLRTPFLTERLRWLLLRKAHNKLHALRRIRNYLTIKKAELPVNAYINSQFTYAPFIWMFAGKSSIAKICKINFRTLQAVYNLYDKPYHDLLNLSLLSSIALYKYVASCSYDSFILIS